MGLCIVMSFTHKGPSPELSHFNYGYINNWRCKKMWVDLFAGYYTKLCRYLKLFGVCYRDFVFDQSTSEKHSPWLSIKVIFFPLLFFLPWIICLGLMNYNVLWLPNNILRWVNSWPFNKLFKYLIRYTSLSQQHQRINEEFPPLHRGFLLKRKTCICFNIQLSYKQSKLSAW